MITENKTRRNTARTHFEHFSVNMRPPIGVLQLIK